MSNRHTSAAARMAGVAALVTALLLLDAAVTFYNIWPTPAVHWTGHFSVELAVVLLSLSAIATWRGSVSQGVRRAISAAWVVLLVGRYAAVTAPALYGRDINLYWDIRHVSSLAGMMARAASPWLVVLVVVVLVLAPLLLYVPLRWAFGRVSDALEQPRTRRVLNTAAGVLIAAFVAQQVLGDRLTVPTFAVPVTTVYRQQARVLARAVAARMGGGLLPLALTWSLTCRV